MRRIATISVLFVMAAGGTPSADDWDTYYERSGHRRTPSYDETVEYCRRLADASPWIQYTSFGTSPRGRELPLLIVDRNGNFTPARVRQTDNVVFLIQAGIHSGEIDGKDAGLMLLRDIAIRRRQQELIDHVTILFMPIFNVDGHERKSRFSRANQNGPEEMGWRATATNLNLNRDYMKADAPEMRAWIRLYTEWLPEFLADCHVTDGSDYEYVVTHAVEVYGNTDARLSDWARERYLEPLREKMAASGFPIIRYVWFKSRDVPASGIVSWAADPRFCTGYVAAHNRAGVLVETHSLKDYRTRVEGTYEMLRQTLLILGDEHRALRRACAEADRRTASAAFRREPFPLVFETGPDSVMIEFRGVESELVESDLTGGRWPRWGEKVTLRIPYFNTQVPVKRVALPEAYIVPPEWRDVIDLLQLHGVAFGRLAGPVTLDVQSYRFEDVEWESKPFEGRHRLTYEVVPLVETRTFPAGSVVVPMDQRAARVAAHALEPGGPDSFLSWGFFDTIFEQKEYVESYVIEHLAREMLAQDQSLRGEFQAWKASHPDDASDPALVRRWFYRRTPYWDDRIGVYPVGRITERETLERILR